MRTLRPGRLIRFTIALALVAVLLGAAAATAAPKEPAREPFFPHAGNPGYDVRHYDVHLAYRPGPGRLRATTTLTRGRDPAPAAASASTSTGSTVAGSRSTASGPSSTAARTSS